MKDKYKICQCIHYSMSACGGFLGGYAILDRCDVFGNALTSNMIHLVFGILGRNPIEVLMRLGTVFLYMLGTILTVLLPRYTKWNVRVISVAIDMCVIIILRVMPRDVPIIISLYPITFAMSFQWNVFANICGHVSSTIFSTNNTRQMSISLTRYICDGKEEDAKRARFYAGVLLFYHIGVALSYLAWRLNDIKAVYIGWIPMVTALFFISFEAGWIFNSPSASKESEIIRR